MIDEEEFVDKYVRTAKDEGYTDPEESLRNSARCLYETIRCMGYQLIRVR